MLSLLDTINIFKSIVVNDPSDSQIRLNTFFMIEEDEKKRNYLNTEFTLDDYRSGFFWNRSLAGSGGDSTKIGLETAMLGIDIYSSNFEICDESEAVYEIWLNLFHKPNCLECPENQRMNKNQLDILLPIKLRQIINNFFSFSLITENGEGKWVSRAKKADMIANGAVFTDTNITPNPRELKINTRKATLHLDGYRLHNAPLTLALCDSVVLPDFYEYDAGTGVSGVVKCSSCPPIA